jgi:hypothetical protein
MNTIDRLVHDVRTHEGLRVRLDDLEEVQRQQAENEAAIRALGGPKNLGDGVSECRFCGIAWWPNHSWTHVPGCPIAEHAPAIARAEGKK